MTYDWPCQFSSFTRLQQSHKASPTELHLRHLYLKDVSPMQIFPLSQYNFDCLSIIAVMRLAEYFALMDSTGEIHNP